MQTMAQELGGTVIQSDKREFGHATISRINNSILFDEVKFKNDTLDVWMSHGDKVSIIPSDFNPIAESKNCLLQHLHIQIKIGLDYNFILK